MTRQFWTRTVLAAAVMVAIPAMLVGCDKGAEETPPPAPTKVTTPVTPVIPATPTTLGAIPGMAAAGTAATDTAAQGMIEQAQALIKTDLPKAKSLLEQLKANDMYSKLSPEMKSKVDALEKAIDAASSKM